MPNALKEVFTSKTVKQLFVIVGCSRIFDSALGFGPGLVFESDFDLALDSDPAFDSDESLCGSRFHLSGEISAIIIFHPLNFG
ncbi:hypothetical protein EVAR_42614_1 [Eumeta japonica]|uniref:Uncharacterized protein n=1 Tax=Eumeta variegata TaxID=151549 RepID=A0A4C1XNN6_EUMVA|nr:hypothetical protein EVAR_42614_1 [Eumeta japonica]